MSTQETRHQQIVDKGLPNFIPKLLAGEIDEAEIRARLSNTGHELHTGGWDELLWADLGIIGERLLDEVLRQLKEKTGLEIRRAYRRNDDCEACVLDGDGCKHAQIDWATGTYEWIDPNMFRYVSPYWSSCPQGVRNNQATPRQ